LLGLIGPGAAEWNNSFGAALSLTFSSGWPWACYAFLVGFLCRSKIMAGSLSFAGLTTGVTIYYLFKYMNPYVPPGATNTIGEGFSSGVVLWGIYALALGLPMGLVGHLARNQGLVALPFRIVVPAIAFFETTLRLDVEAEGQDYVTLLTWNVTRYAAATTALVIFGHAAWSFWCRHRRGSTESDAYRTHHLHGE
ncbi:MAG: hypothetical protein ACI39M_21010, partial [Streptomyces albidoflavus]